MKGFMGTYEFVELPRFGSHRIFCKSHLNSVIPQHSLVNVHQAELSSRVIPDSIGILNVLALADSYHNRKSQLVTTSHTWLVPVRPFQDQVRGSEGRRFSSPGDRVKYMVMSNETVPLHLTEWPYERDARPQSSRLEVRSLNKGEDTCLI